MSMYTLHARPIFELLIAYQHATKARAHLSIPIVYVALTEQWHSQSLLGCMQT